MSKINDKQYKKKKKEKEILNKVYNVDNEDRYRLIEEKEAPDFVLEDLKTNETFGVEITKLYYNQSTARLKEIPNYEAKLLKNGIPRKDKGTLGVHKIYISIDDEWVYLTDSIGHNLGKYDDYIDALVNVINTKTEKAKKYKKLDYLELFIDDRENFFFFKKIEDFKKFDKSEKIWNAIDKSPFRRIYLFTIINKQEMLRIAGDLHSGPLYEGEEVLKKHKEYMDNLYKDSES